MDRQCFQDIWKDVISKYVDEIESIDELSGYNCLKFRKYKVNRIYHYYEKKRLEIRRYFMNLESKPMDRHKIGAVLIYAILRSNLFQIKKRAKCSLPEQLLMANQYLALYVGLSVVESYKRDDYISTHKELPQEDIDKQRSSWELILPHTYHGDSAGAYIHTTCKALYYNTRSANFDVFAYANILFLLERYTDTVKELPTPLTES